MKSRIIFGNLYRADPFLDLPVKGKLLAIYLMTNENIGLVPAYRLNKREIAFSLELDKEKIDLAVDGLKDLGIFRVKDYVVFCNIYSNYIYHKGNNNKNREAMLKEFLLLPEEVQLKLLEMNFDLEGMFKVPYGYPQGTSKVFINNKPEIINNKLKIINHKKEIINNKPEISKEDLKKKKEDLYEKMNWK